MAAKPSPGDAMLLHTMISALGRRKAEAVVLAAVAGGTAVGLRTSAEQQGVASVAEVAKSAVTVSAPASAPSMTYLSAAVSKIPAVRTTPSRSVEGLPNIANANVDAWVKKFTTHRAGYATYLRRMTKYDEMISAKLAKKNMPQGLIYLAMIESGFNPTAKSPVGARGLWQFMSPTARQYGLKVRGRVDERTNPARATDAAIEYLSDLHDRFGSWYLAAAAYNTGQGRVARVLKQVTGQTKGTDADFYRIAHRLPKETRDYVPKLIAAARIGSNPAQYGFAD
jgi:membrane-bound lytic murein transglycosylase D